MKHCYSWTDDSYRRYLEKPGEYVVDTESKLVNIKGDIYLSHKLSNMRPKEEKK